MVKPDGSSSEEDMGSILGPGRSPEEGNSNPHQYSCRKNSMDRGAWRAPVQGITKVKHALATKQQRVQYM